MRPPHLRGRLRFVWLIATLFLASCASQPPTREVDDSVRLLRAEYLHDNPAGPFNRNIERGEITPGMRFDEVLASWGIPEARERNGAAGREWWTYTITDLWSRDWVRYDILFDGGELASWETMRNVSSSHPITGSIPAAGASSAHQAVSPGVLPAGGPRR